MSRWRYLSVLAGTMIAVSIASCSKEKSSPLESRNMPAGYEAVSDAFGVRAGGLVHQDGMYLMPVVEFRTDNDYALYPVSTKCDGSFARGSGTVFTSEGTVKENIQQQALQQVSASPQLAPVIDRICRDAKASRFVSDPFKPQEALALLFGSPDAKGEVQWKHEGSDGLEAGIKRVSLRKSGEFTQGQERWAYIITGSRDPECEAHACGGGAIGAALFRFNSGKWLLATHIPIVTIAGGFGNTTDAQGIKNLQPEGKLPLISIVSVYCQMGECNEGVDLIAVVDGKFAQVWEGQTAYSSLGTTSCEQEGRCDDWSSQFKTIPVKGGELPDVQVKTTGKRWDEDSGKLFAVNDNVIYRYDPVGKYHEISRDSTPVEIPLPPRQPEAQEKAAGMAQVSPIIKEEAETCAGPDRNAVPQGALAPPMYPREEMRRGVQGVTTIVVSIDGNGDVSDVEVSVSSGNESLDREAVKAARRWKFNPAIKDCRFTATRIRTPLAFKLN